MQVRRLCGVALAALVLLGGARALAADSPKDVQAEPASPFKPTVLVRIKSLDELVADARYLAKDAGREDEVKKAEKGLEKLEGIDRKKPIGLYGSLAAKITDSEAVFMLPVTGEDDFVKLLKGINLEAEKDKDGIYTVASDSIPFPILFRVANGYAYATVKFGDKVSLPAKNKLPLPSTVFTQGGGLLSLTANIDRVPAQIRKVGISGSALYLGNLKDEKDENLSDAQNAVRGALLDSAAILIKSLLLDGEAVTLKLDVDRKKNDLSLSFSLEGKNGSKLAKDLAAWGAEKGVAASLLSKDSVMGGYLRLSAPAVVRKVLGPAVDELVKSGLEKLDKDPQDLLAPLADAVKPTAKEGTLDVGLNMRGPGKSGKYTLVGSVQVADGAGIEKAAKKVLDKLPDEAKKPFKTDIAKAEGINIHQVEPNDLSEKHKETFGEGPVYFALRKDALIFATGDNALETLKTAIAAKPKAGRTAQLELAMNHVVKLAPDLPPGAVELAKKAFKEKGSDKVRLTVESGGKLEVKLSVKTAVVTLVGLLDKAKKEAEQKEKSADQ